MNYLQITAIISIIIVIVNLVLFVLNLITPFLFWMVILAAALFAWFGVPKLKKNNKN
ncbi:hypothetical protein GF361_03275 [Candidatus Woesearchaeota archaeon]|nr:hypothetical protein [Candidatus Woesearchaeota archaeon]